MLTGTIDKIIYRDKDFIVALIDKTKICGALPGAYEGMKVALNGKFVDHPKYGKQYNFTSYKIQSDYPYLASGFVRHLGEATAKQIVKLFPNPIKTILNEPEKLTAIKGISLQKAKEIHESVKETLKYRQICIDLEPCKLMPLTLAKIYDNFKEYSEILENPYILTKVDLIGFQKADNIAQKLGIKQDSPQRIQAAAQYALTQSTHEGHVYLTDRELAERTYKLLNERIHPTLIEANIKQLPGEDNRKYIPHLLESENKAVELLLKFKPSTPIDVSEYLQNYELNLSPSQKKAVLTAFKENLMIITGGPGTGKTETIKAITTIYDHIYPTHKITLAAPTGRASRKMSEVTGLNAQTVHRLIRSGQTIKGLLIIDEASMIDIELLPALLQKTDPETRIIFVGDPDQLPSVGPGQVLKDLIEIFPTIKLTEIFRQARDSNIIINAHLINTGKIDLKTGKDFYFIRQESPEKILETIRKHITRQNIDSIQLLSPMKKGTLGTDNLNALLQDIAVPGTGKYRKGDRVIQLVNNYTKNVFNGDIGTIVSTSPFIVRFNQDVEYLPYELDQITHAYAITVHKSQGSEFPIVVIPLSTQHYVMLNRQILYTAVTRARKKVILIGSYKALSLAVGNVQTHERNSALAKKIKKSLATNICFC